MPKTILTQAQLKEILDYNPETGTFAWKQRCQGRQFTKEPGCIYSTSGYRLIRIKYERYPAHRLAFVLMTGSAPEQVDHINGVRSDNRWCNLRAANQTINGRNQGIHRDNTSGETAIHRKKRYRGWIVVVNRTYVGHFYTMEEAVEARNEVYRSLGYHPNHGGERPRYG